MPAKLLGLALLLTGFLLQLGVARARLRGYIGPRRRRIYRDTERSRFRFALAKQIAGALICLAAGALCLAKGLRH